MKISTVKYGALKSELRSLRRERNDLCDQFLSRKISIPTFCVQLDALGKRFQDNCFYASHLEYRKYPTWPGRALECLPARI